MKEQKWMWKEKRKKKTAWKSEKIGESSSTKGTHNVQDEIPCNQ